MTNLKCSKCGITVQIGDLFCEECGASLSSSTPVQGGCAKCGAPASAIDAEGYCNNCGFHTQPRSVDNWEIVISSQLAGVTDRGLRHPHNQDYFACAKADHDNFYVMVVCDGVSSSATPELAAKAAAESAVQVLSTATAEIDINSVMHRAITQAMISVCAVPYLPNSDEDSPSTTIVAAIVVNNMATIGWLGDSRAYWISAQGSRQLTQDDSWINEVVASGKMPLAEAQLSPHAHAITRWLGADAVEFKPAIINFEIPSSGYLILCTDGLWHYAPECSHMEAIINSDDAINVAHNLTEFAKSKGGCDNITVAVLTINNEQ